MTSAFFDSPSKLTSVSTLCPLDPLDFLNNIFQGSPDSPLLCGNCEEDARAASRCKDCDELLCESCVKAHVRVKFTKDHCIIPLGDRHKTPSSYSSSSNVTTGSSPSLMVNSNTNKMCEIHQKETVQVYCDNCSIIFCAKCNSLEHNGHNFLLLEDAVEKARSSYMKHLSEANLNAMTTKKCLDNSQRMVESINSRGLIVNREIKNMMNRFHMAIEERESELLERLKHIITLKYKAIQNQIQTFRTLYSRFSQASNKLTDALESGIPVDIIQVRDNTSAELKRLRTMRSSMVPVDDTIQVVPPDWSILLAINSMGGIAGHSQVALEQSSMFGEEAFRNVARTSLLQNSNYLEDFSNLKERISSISITMSQDVSLICSTKEVPNKINLRSKISSSPRNYTDAGVPVLIIGEEGEEDGKFCRPWGVCCSIEGNIIVADRSNNRIQVFRPDGTFIFKFGTHGSAPGKFDRPAGVTTDFRNRIIVADKDNHRIQIFTNNGVFLLTFGEKGSKVCQFNYPWDVASDSQGRIAVSDSRNHRIQLFDGEGTFIAKFGYDITPNTIKNFDSPRGVCFGSNDFVIVTDFNNHRLVVIDPSFRTAKFLGTEGMAEKQFSRPQGIAIDPAGKIVVSDSRNNRIQVLDPKGNYIYQFGTGGVEPGHMDRPSGLCISPTGNIIVVDFGNNRIQIF